MSQTVPTVTAAKRRQRCPAAFCFWGRGGHASRSTPRLSERFGILDRVGMDFPIQAAGSAGTSCSNM